MDLFEAIERGREDDVSRLLDADPNSLETRNHAVSYGLWYRPLGWAALHGRLGMARLLIQRGANIHSTGCLGRTALFCASERGHEDTVVFLMSQGAHADITDREGMTHLMAAASGGHLGMVKMLLQHMGGQGLNEADHTGRTALHYAAAEGHEELVAYLLSQGAHAYITEFVGLTLFMEAAAGGHVGVVKTLLQHMGGQGLNQTDFGGRTALYHAADRGHEETVAFLLSQGANVDSTDHIGMTPFMAAAWSGHVGVVKMLLQHMGGQGLNQADREGRTALYCASELGHEETATLLLSQGARVDATDEDGMTSLITAAKNGHVGVVKMLLHHLGAQGLDERDSKGRTALYYAAERGHGEIVAFLMSQGAQVDITDQEGMTPFMAAAAGGHVGMVTMLLPHMGGQCLQETDNEGRTALLHASDKGREGMLRALLFAGADPTITDHKGRTPRAVAHEKGHQGCVKIFKVSTLDARLAMHSLRADIYAYPSIYLWLGMVLSLRWPCMYA
jgi:serine/threonine-protein phosphatase 6 regulatory ankyrin repeat subunit B